MTSKGTRPARFGGTQKRVDRGLTGGAAAPVPVTGAMTIHGTTRTVTIPMTARLSASTIEIVGSILSGRGTAF
jgi:hypothetical protein